MGLVPAGAEYQHQAWLRWTPRCRRRCPERDGTKLRAAGPPVPGDAEGSLGGSRQPWPHPRIKRATVRYQYASLRPSRRTFTASHPKRCDHSSLATALPLRQRHLRIDVTNTLSCPVTHPLAIVTDVIRWAAGSRPHPHPAHLLLRRRIHGRLAGELGRDLNESFGDEDSDRVQIAAMRFQPQPLRFERNRATAAEGIVNRRRVPVRGLQDLVMGSFQNRRVVRVVPLHQLFDQPEEPLTLFVLVGFGRKLLRKARWVIHQRSEQYRTARRQWAPRPPEMQRRWVPVPNRLLPRRLLIDRLQRQRDFDEFLFHFSRFVFHASRSVLSTSRRMSGMPTPNGASFIQAFSTIILIFFSSSDQATIPLDHDEALLASAPEPSPSRAGLSTRRGLRIQAAAEIKTSSSIADCSVGADCSLGVPEHGSEYRFASSLPASPRRWSGSRAAPRLATRRPHHVLTNIGSGHVPRAGASAAVLPASIDRQPSSKRKLASPGCLPIARATVFKA